MGLDVTKDIPISHVKYRPCTGNQRYYIFFWRRKHFYEQTNQHLIQNAYRVSKIRQECKERRKVEITSRFSRSVRFHCGYRDMNLYGVITSSCRYIWLFHQEIIDDVLTQNLYISLALIKCWFELGTRGSSNSLVTT